MSLTLEVVESRAIVTTSLYDAHNVTSDAFDKIRDAQKAYIESKFPVTSSEAKALYQRIVDAQGIYNSAFTKYIEANENFKKYFTLG